MDIKVFYRPAIPGERATQIDQLISERNVLLAALGYAALQMKVAVNGSKAHPQYQAWVEAEAAIAKAEGR